MPAKSSKNWFEKQPITIKGAIIGGLFALLAAFLTVFVDRVIPNNSITLVMLITPTPENFVAVTPLPAPVTQIVQLENPQIQSVTSLSRAVRLQIPKLNLDAPIVLGDNTEQLKKGVGQHIGSQNPGENGIIVLSAHNDSYGELFRFLDNLLEGDSIFVYTNESKYEYIVEKSQIVNTKKADVVFSPDDSILLLVSNYPYLVNNQYIIVSAYLKREP